MSPPLPTRFPLIIAEGLDVATFASLAQAEGYYEPWVAREPTVRGYDADGRRLTITVEGGSTRRGLFATPDAGRVRIRLAEETPSAADALRGLLVEYLRDLAGRGLAVPESPDALALRDLVDAAHRFARA